MTDVLILHSIPGEANVRGAVVPYEKWMDGHIAAGNAKIVPNEHPSWGETEADQTPPAPVLQAASTGTYDDHDLDSATYEEE